VTVLAAASTYLANKPDGANLAFLIVCVIFLAFAAVAAFTWRTVPYWATLLCVGLAFGFLAFMVK
jgi:hypothetical protein